MLYYTILCNALAFWIFLSNIPVLIEDRWEWNISSDRQNSGFKWLDTMGFLDLLGYVATYWMKFTCSFICFSDKPLDEIDLCLGSKIIRGWPAGWKFFAYQAVGIGFPRTSYGNRDDFWLRLHVFWIQFSYGILEKSTILKIFVHLNIVNDGWWIIIFDSTLFAQCVRSKNKGVKWVSILTSSCSATISHHALAGVTD